jgi:hypothetical protein
LFLFRQNHADILSLLVESGAMTSQEGWMKIGDDSMFGSPLLLALWFQKKFGSSEVSEKIFQIIYHNYEKQYSSIFPKGILILRFYWPFFLNGFQKNFFFLVGIGANILEKMIIQKIDRNNIFGITKCEEKNCN